MFDLVGLERLELSTSRLSGVRSNHLSYRPARLVLLLPAASHNWWSWTGLNRRPPACKADALPAELQPQGAASQTIKHFASQRTWSLIESEQRAGSFSIKEVIQPQVPLRLPCYDFTPIIGPTVDGCLHCWLAYRLRVKPTFVV